MKSRLGISNAKMVFTQDFVLRGGKALPLYARLVEANAPQTIVLPASSRCNNAGIQNIQPLRAGDMSFSQLKHLSPVPNNTIEVFSSRKAGSSSWWNPCPATEVSPQVLDMPHVAEASATTNILFSSGTTGEPKAIVWSHITPLRCFADGWAHQDIKPGLSVIMGEWEVEILTNVASSISIPMQALWSAGLPT